MSELKVNRLVPWFGSDLGVAQRVGIEVSNAWVGVTMVGGASAIPFIKCRQGVASDLHRHVINLARVLRDPSLKDAMVQRLDAAIFHPDELRECQLRCLQREAEQSQRGGLFGGAGAVGSEPDVGWAYDYFLSVWMARGGKAGTGGEFAGALPVRWNANGGGSNVRYRSAVESLDGWQAHLFRWEFDTVDVFDFLERVWGRWRKGDVADKSVYMDPPWWLAGDEYKHGFTERQHRRLAVDASRFKKVRVVIRYGDHPFIRELYPAGKWNIIEQVTRDQDNKDVPEILILNGPSLAGGGK